MREAEEQIAHRLVGAGLAGFVGAIDHVQPRVLAQI